MVNKVLKGIKNPKLLLLYVLGFGFFRLIPDKMYLKIEYKLQIGKKLDLENPKSFNEKLQWLKLHDRKPVYTKLVDKYEVRSYISETIGEQYLIPLLGVYDTYDEIDFNNLPREFVLKPNHTSGNVYICRDKSKIDYSDLKKEVNKWLKREYYWIHREWPYKNIKPRIIAEKLMVDDSGVELKDYKFMCFNGEVKCLFVSHNRHLPGGLNVDFYDLEWNRMNFKRHYSNSSVTIPKPERFDQMIEYAKKISKDLLFVRIDFYEVNGELYFGEFTLYPGSGYEEFTPESYDYLLGSWIDLSGNLIKGK